jgi:hypothetical protein
MLDRRALLLGGAAALAALGRPTRSAAQDVVVEDWRALPVGQAGVPAGWRKYETPRGNPAYDFHVVEAQGRKALTLKSAGDHSTIAKEVTVDLRATPKLTWSWRVTTLPRGADLRQRSTSDATGHIFVVWPRFPEMLRSRLIGYVWDPALEPGAIVKSRKTGTVSFVVVRSGERGLGEWVTDTRDVVADYHVIHGEAPENPRAIALSIDTNDTGARAEASFGPIAFTR